MQNENPYTNRELSHQLSSLQKTVESMHQTLSWITEHLIGKHEEETGVDLTCNPNAKSVVGKTEIIPTCCHCGEEIRIPLKWNDHERNRTLLFCSEDCWAGSLCDFF